MRISLDQLVTLAPVLLANRSPSTLPVTSPRPPVDLTAALNVLAQIYASRVIILPSAWRSASDAAAFNRPDKALELMLQLAGPYWTAIQDHGDEVARRVFTPGAFAARESRTVERHPSARARRTFAYSGKPVTMWRHLRLGVKDSVVTTWRLHFAFDPEIARIVIGHCGHHLDFA